MVGIEDERYEIRVVFCSLFAANRGQVLVLVTVNRHSSKNLYFVIGLSVSTDRSKKISSLTGTIDSTPINSTTMRANKELQKDGILCRLSHTRILSAGMFLFMAFTFFEMRKIETSTLKSFSTTRVGPFQMPIEGESYSISQPLYDLEKGRMFVDHPLYDSPQNFISYFEKHIDWAMQYVTNEDKLTSSMSRRKHAIFAYIQFMKSMVSATAFNDAEISVKPHRTMRNIGITFDADKRKNGTDWTFLGDTMTGWARLDNVYKLLTEVIENNIPGDYIETGVWRGGSSILARAIITALGEKDNRVSYVCDSFSGLPPGDRNLDKGDKNWDNTPYLEIPYEVVASNFAKYGLLDSNVIFVKGFFRDSMFPLSKEVKRLSIMRLDGDMYESTVDVLYRLYDKLSLGGYVIIDDWFGFPARTACEDFFKVHGINPEIIAIDTLSVYWKKTEEIKIQYWRYEQSKFK